jgi:hypothetical protein
LLCFVRFGCLTSSVYTVTRKLSVSFVRFSCAASGGLENSKFYHNGGFFCRLRVIKFHARSAEPDTVVDVGENALPMQ